MTYDPKKLRALPTLSTGQADSLKIDTGVKRVWLCRCGRADGMCCDAHVTIEALSPAGRWETVEEECHD